MIGIGLVYGVLFYFTAIFDNIFLRALLLFALTFIYPFGFNWLQLELPFINSYLGTSKLDFLFILVAIITLVKFLDYKKYFAIILLILAMNYSSVNILAPNIKISMADINILQKNKWDRKYLKEIININLEAIDQAIKQKSDLVILPESTFPLLLNKNEKLLSLLKEKSKYISIITGSLYEKDNMYHNSTYFFDDQQIQIAHKVVLIPFGEAVPLPEKLRHFINDIFYQGAKDYQSAKVPTDFIIKGITFRNAICYEATTDDIFQNMKRKYMIAISNNAWFNPSIQPVLQKLLLKYYALKYDVKIFSISNMSNNYVVN